MLLLEQLEALFLLLPVVVAAQNLPQHRRSRAEQHMAQHSSSSIKKKSRLSFFLIFVMQHQSGQGFILKDVGLAESTHSMYQ